MHAGLASCSGSYRLMTSLNLWQRLKMRARRQICKADVASKITQTADMSEDDLRIIAYVRPYTMTSDLRIEALLKAVRFVVSANISGAMVECGVWRGGSVLAMILQLQQLGVTDRDIYLYDTFDGMPEPTEKDTSEYEKSALETWNEAMRENRPAWDNLFSPSVFNEQDVQSTILATGYPADKIHFIRGRVEDTIPASMPPEIAILRLDTDWYESTRHELQHLYPRLEKGGVLIIDDYGHWDGARAAVDEYFSDKALLLHRIDYTGRAAIKI